MLTFLLSVKKYNRQQSKIYKTTEQNNKLQIIAPELRHSFYSVTVIQGYIEFIIKKSWKITH